MSLLSVAVLSVALLAGPSQDQHAEAERLARAGSHVEALQRFQAIVAANPDDIGARMWIARLHSLMGHNERAVEVYRSIVATVPQHLDALIGLGLTLIDQGQLTEAADALTRAEAIAPDRPAVLAAQGRLHAQAGRTTLALAYYERALALEPANAETRSQYDALRAHRAHRIEGTYYFEHFNNDAPDTHSGILKVNGRISDAVRAFALGQFQRKRSEDESRFGGGVEWSPRHDVRTRFLAAAGSDLVILPEVEVDADVEFDTSPVTWLGRVRYVDFATSKTTILSPGVGVPAGDRLRFDFRYYHSESEIDNALDDISNDGATIDALFVVSPRVSAYAGYGHGFESLSLLMDDRFTLLDGDILTAGTRFDLAPMTTFSISYQHQWRDDDTNVATAFVTFVQRF